MWRMLTTEGRPGLWKVPPWELHKVTLQIISFMPFKKSPLMLKLAGNDHTYLVSFDACMLLRQDGECVCHPEGALVPFGNLPSCPRPRPGQPVTSFLSP